MVARRRRGRAPHPDVLTPAEWRVLGSIRHGLSRRAVAERLGISENAVKYHVANITTKLGVFGMAALRHWPGYPGDSPLASRRILMAGPPALVALGQVSLLTRDIDRAERFYRDTLSLPHLFTFGDLAFFHCGGTRLFVRAVPDAEWRPSSILYFTVDDIVATSSALAGLGVIFVGQPHLIHRDEAAGVEEWMAFFDDPDGNTLALMSRVVVTQT